jgi:hypothetical protein
MYRKDLILMGCNKNSLTQLLTRAEVFKDIKHRHGYATNYTNKQVMLLLLGCKLLKVYKFRVVNKALVNAVNDESLWVAATEEELEERRIEKRNRTNTEVVLEKLKGYEYI